MLSLGLGLTIDDFKRVFVYPKAFAIGALCQIFLLPIVTFIMLSFVKFPAPLEFGIMLISFCPGGVTSNIFTKLANGAVALSISLTGIVSILCVFTLPIGVAISANHFLSATDIKINIGTLGLNMLVIAALPAAIGVCIRHYFPAFSQKIENPLFKIAGMVFVTIVISSIIGNRSLLAASFYQIGPFLILLNISLLLLGFLIARFARLPDDEAVTISIETGFQNGAMGITIGSLIAGSAAQNAALSLPSAVYGLLMYFICIPFILWARRKLTPNIS